MNFEQAFNLRAKYIKENAPLSTGVQQLQLQLLLELAMLQEQIDELREILNANQ